jgi:hypothetical protein
VRCLDTSKTGPALITTLAGTKREKKSFGLPELPSPRSPFLFVRALHGHHYVKEEIVIFLLDYLGRRALFVFSPDRLQPWRVGDAPVSDICLIIQ